MPKAASYAICLFVLKRFRGVLVLCGSITGWGEGVETVDEEAAGTNVADGGSDIGS